MRDRRAGIKNYWPDEEAKDLEVMAETAEANIPYLLRLTETAEVALREAACVLSISHVAFYDLVDAWKRAGEGE